MDAVVKNPTKKEAPAQIDSGLLCLFKISVFRSPCAGVPVFASAGKQSTVTQTAKQWENDWARDEQNERMHSHTNTHTHTHTCRDNIHCAVASGRVPTAV